MTPQTRPTPSAGPDSASTSATGDSWIRLIGEHLPRRFADAGALERLSSRLALLPATGLIALELHLGSGRPRIDLSQRFETPEGARAFAARAAATGLDTLIEAWARGELEKISSLWFEMDLPPAGEITPEPAVITCAGLEPDAEPLWITDRLAPRFRSGGLSAAQRRTLLGALGHLREAGGRPIYLFDLEPRGAGLVRLDTLGLDQPAMAAFLRRFAPAHAQRQVADLPAWVNDLGRHHLSFDIHPDGEIGDRLGIELSNVKLPHRDPRWGRLLDNLVADGLCDRDTREAIESWSGKDDRHTAAAWPPESELSGGCCARCLSHVKLVTRPDRPAEAKVYLLLQFLDRAALRRNDRRQPVH